MSRINEVLSAAYGPRRLRTATCDLIPVFHDFGTLSCRLHRTPFRFPSSEQQSLAFDQGGEVVLSPSGANARNIARHRSGTVYLVNRRPEAR